MEFNEKLQELRKQKGLTQEELAAVLYVSRTAVSKWESGRGLPNIESLKAISRYFSITLDDLLSGDDLLVIAETDQKERESHNRDLIFGLLDCSVLLLLFLPLFGQTAGDGVRAVSLLTFGGGGNYLTAGYFAVTASSVIMGVLTLALQNFYCTLWVNSKRGISLVLGAVAVLLFIVSRQPYAAAFVFVFLCIKALLLLKK